MAIDTSMLKFGKPTPKVEDRRNRRLSRAAKELQARIAVTKRDKARCVVPGCKEKARHLHHIVFRSRGGKCDTSNLCSLCPGHHALLHNGKITITGNADEHLTITGDAKYLRFKL